MKTNYRILFVATVAAALAGDACLGGSREACIARAATDQALAASPRYREEHPEMQRIPDSAEEVEARWAQSRQQLRKLAQNRALTSSPRFLEVYPELTRAPETVEESEASWTRSREQVAKLAENRALASSPRFLEVYRELLFPATLQYRPQVKQQTPKHEGFTAE